MRRWLLALIALLGVTGSASSQDVQPTERIEFRVLSDQGNGRVIIDRGKGDGLEIGDVAIFFPRSGGSYRGTLDEVDARSGIVKLLDPGITLDPGTRGEAIVPASRFGEVPAPPAADSEEPEAVLLPPVADPAAGTDAATGDPTFQNADEAYKPGMPLLSAVRAQRPESRPMSLSGYVFVTGFTTQTTEGDRADNYIRSGTDFSINNPFDYGGTIRFNGEVNARHLERSDEDDDDDSNARLERASYRYGGTRFSPMRWEAGRFLQFGMPEFGVVDGGEWGLRFENGHRFSASFGFMPEPDDDMDTGDDVQISAAYTWVADPRERISLSAGVQKTWHDGDRDRDLFVTKARANLDNGWNLNAVSWVDYYTDGDGKGDGFDFTAAVASASKRWDSGADLDVVYRHQEFADIDFNSYREPGDDEVDDGHYDRLVLSGSNPMEKERRFHWLAAGWIDEDDEGGDAETGLEFPLFTDARADITVFGTIAKFEKDFGFRVALERATVNGRWDLLYELADHRLDGFSGNRNDLLQHHFRASRDVRFGHGWWVSISADGFLYDDDGAATLGLYLQRSF